MFGSGILEHIIDLWEMCVSERRIARRIRETYGLPCGKDAADAALKAVGTALKARIRFHTRVPGGLAGGPL